MLDAETRDLLRAKVNEEMRERLTRQGDLKFRGPGRRRIVDACNPGVDAVPSGASRDPDVGEERKS